MGQAGEQAELREYTTLRLGGPARRFLTAAADDEVVAAVAAADERGEPVLVLGGGSNLVVSDEGFPGTVIRVATRGIRGVTGISRAARPAGGKAGDRAAVPDRTVELTVAAGEDWDHVVATCVSNGLAGLECLSGIPGRAGATPVQNVGAYGQEVSETITRVRGYDRERREIVELTGADCGFGYRTSAFKRQAQAAAAAAGAAAATGNFVVLTVTFQLTRSELSGPVRYGELARTLGIGEGDRAPLAYVRSAVLGLRRGKGMVLDPADPDTRSAGSFFINPVLDEAQFAALGQAVAGRGGGSRIPCYPGPDGTVKVSAAWLIEQAGFRKGYPGNGTDGPRISAKHTLALVNPGGATAASLAGLAREVRDGVRQAFGVELLPEPVLVGPGLALLSG